MKQVYSSPDMVSAQMVKDYLVAYGIEAFVQGDLLIGGVGELPANNYISVWVINDVDFERAEIRVQNYESLRKDDQVYDSVWKCIGCNELIDAQFTGCWKCGGERPNNRSEKT